MISKRTYELEGRKGNPTWQVAVFRGWDDWRIGVYVEHHRLETQVSLHVPCLSLNIIRFR